VSKYPERIRASLKQPHLEYVKQKGEALQPSYELPGGGVAASPTGRILVRFANADTMEKRRKDIEAAGYVIDEILSYAPQAAWVRAASGDAGEGLSGVTKLEAIAGIEEVEPQMLRPRALK
jgi:hypothetical protein